MIESLVFVGRHCWAAAGVEVVLELTAARRGPANQRSRELSSATDRQNAVATKDSCFKFGFGGSSAHMHSFTCTILIKACWIVNIEWIAWGDRLGTSLLPFSSMQ